MAITKVANSNANVKQLTNADVQSGINGISILYNAIVGSAAQVLDGTATHSSLQAAVNSIGSTGAIYFLDITVTENVTISSSSIRIIGKGRSSVLNGTLTVSGNYNDLDSFKIVGNITLSGNNNFMKNWMGSSASFSNTGLANDYRITQE